MYILTKAPRVQTCLVFSPRKNYSKKIILHIMKTSVKNHNLAIVMTFYTCIHVVNTTIKNLLAGRYHHGRYHHVTFIASNSFISPVWKMSDINLKKNNLDMSLFIYRPISTRFSTSIEKVTMVNPGRYRCNEVNPRWP